MTREHLDALLGQIFENARDAVGLSADNVVRMANPAMVQLFGYKEASEIVGRSFFELLAPEDRARMLEYVKLRASGREVPGSYTPHALRADGTRVQIEVRTTTFVLDGTAYALALIRDLTKDRRSAADLYEAIFAKNTAVKLLIDPTDGQIVDANSAAVAFYGWPAETLRTMRIRDINTLSEAEIAAEMERARVGERTRFRFRHRIASGEVRHVEVHSGPVEVAGRSLLLSIVHDTTEREELELQVRDAHKLDAVGRLAGGVAHDFNNLLTIILTSAELLTESVPKVGPASRLIGDLCNAARRASDLTERLMAVGQRQHLVPQVVDLAEIVRGMERLLRAAVGPRVELSLVLSDGQAAMADPGQLDRVLTNLVLNAGQAIDERGTITVRVREADDPSWVELVVGDDGRGMDEATRSRVFEPFFTTRPVGSGTGLGLATAYGIVIQSGGTIDVETTPGAGSTFTVRLPRAASVAVGDPQVPRTDGAARVLLVEDDAEIRDLLAQGLTHSGFEVTVLRDGAAALALSDPALLSIDVLVTDQVMPGATGVEVARALRARRPGLPVLLISGNLHPRDRAELPIRSHVLAKPFSRAALAEAIQVAVSIAAESPERSGA